MIELSKQEKYVILFLFFFALVGIVAVSIKGNINRVDPKVVSSGTYERAGYSIKRPININKADVGTLSRLPGIGPKLASNIVKYREKNGYFLFPEDLLKVPGIGKAKFEKLKQYISCE